MSIGIKYVHSSFLLSMVLELCLTMNRGAGGFSISPFLQVRGLMRNDSPAFNLIQELKDHSATANLTDIELKVSNVIRQVRRLFDEGKATPSDVNSLGMNLLHVSFQLLLITIRLSIKYR